MIRVFEDIVTIYIIIYKENVKIMSHIMSYAEIKLEIELFLVFSYTNENPGAIYLPKRDTVLLLASQAVRGI